MIRVFSNSFFGFYTEFLSGVFFKELSSLQTGFSYRTPRALANSSTTLPDSAI